MKRTIYRLFAVFVLIYVCLCFSLYFFQESLIFHPKKLNGDYHFDFKFPFEEVLISASDGNHLHGILFKCSESKGLIFFLHGNSGSLDSWGYVAPQYTQLGYDLFMLDYRGFGKSTGVISNETQIFDDVQTAYNLLKRRYNEQSIVVIGYSIGTGIAAKLASENNPSMLVLEAPYYSLTELMKQRFSFIPTFILQYKLATNEYLKSCSIPVCIFHGDQDEVIDYRFSLMLKNEFKQNDTLITLQGQGHTGIEKHPDFIPAIAGILSLYPRQVNN